MVWINWAGPTSHLISDMGGEFEGELGELEEAHCIRQYFTASEATWQNGPVERDGGIWKAAARKTIKDVGARGFVEIRRLASMVNWAKNARSNSSGYSPAQRVIGRGYNLPWSLLDEKRSGALASLELPGHSPEFGRRMSWLWAARRAFGQGFERVHSSRGLCLVKWFFGEKSRKTEPTRGQHLLPISGMVRPLLLAKRRTTCLCLIVVV